MLACIGSRNTGERKARNEGITVCRVGDDGLLSVVQVRTMLMLPTPQPCRISGAVMLETLKPEAAQHVHRVGRTGHADADGWAFSLVSLDEMGRVGRVGRIELLQGREFELQPPSELTPPGSGPLRAPMLTLQILAGRKEEFRAGDVLGALTGDGGRPAALIGEINVNGFSTYVAVAREVTPKDLKGLNDGRVKGKKVKARVEEGS